MLDHLPPWGACLVIVAIAAAAGLAVVLVAYAVLGLITPKDGRFPTRLLARRTRWASRLLGVCIGAGLGLSLCAARGELDAELVVAFQVQRVLLVLALTWMVIGLLGGAGGVVLARYRVDVADNLKARRMHTQVTVISRMAMVGVAIVGFALALTTFPAVRQVGLSMLASAGIAGIVIGFAAQPILGNLIAGVQIALTQPIRLDDVVIIEGQWGRIEEITTTYVVVKIWDERRLIVPFSRIIEQPFENWTRSSAAILGTVMLYADYTVPVGEVRAELRRIVEGHALWDGRVCGLQVTDVTEQTVQLRALVSARDASNAWDLRCEVRERLVDYLRREHPASLPRRREEEWRMGAGPEPAGGNNA